VNDDWSPALVSAVGHLQLGGGYLSPFEWAAFGWVVRDLEPRVEAVHAISSPIPAGDALEQVVLAVLADSLPESLRPFEGLITLALQAGAAALWRSLEVRRVIATSEADLVVQVEP